MSNTVLVVQAIQHSLDRKEFLGHDQTVVSRVKVSGGSTE